MQANKFTVLLFVIFSGLLYNKILVNQQGETKNMAESTTTTNEERRVIKLSNGGRGGNADGPGSVGGRGADGANIYLPFSMRGNVDIQEGRPGSDGIGTNGGQGGKGGSPGQVVWIPG